MHRQDRIRVFTLYWGCKCISDNTVYDVDASVLDAITSFKSQKVQLILKPLFEITDEDIFKAISLILEGIDTKDNIAIITGRNTECAIISVGYLKIRISFINGDLQASDQYGIAQLPIQNIVKYVDFLRACDYALPYKGINLFEAGIAIKSK